MPAEEKLKEYIRKGCIGNKIIPIFCGSAFKNKGVQPLLDAVVDYLPSPLDVPPMNVSLIRFSQACFLVIAVLIIIIAQGMYNLYHGSCFPLSMLLVLW